jgi:hypothetical protein
MNWVPPIIDNWYEGILWGYVQIWTFLLPYAIYYAFLYIRGDKK